jgi:2,4-dienoyl-CoA reductase-like NADH-dependent reductase (Old Yellow Enzyme family)
MHATPRLFEPVQLRGVKARNRVTISPMQQYSADAGGLASDWHLVHLGRFALGGAGIVFVESAAVEPRGRNTHGDIGLWDDSQVAPLSRLARLLRGHGALPAIQLGHTGRKGALQTWWHGHGPLNDADAARGEAPWPLIGPSALPVDIGWPTPEALSASAIESLMDAWGQSARRAAEAGFELLEIHGAHGYLIHQFLSPVANRRHDPWGGNARNRQRFALEVARAVREHWPAHLPLAWRVSLADLDDGTLPMEEMVGFVTALREAGVDILDCSSAAGISTYPSNGARVPRGLDFRAADAAELRRRTGIAIMAVGFVIDPRQAQDYVEQGQADLVAIGREALYDPNWPLHAQQQLEPDPDYELWPRQHRMWLAKRALLADVARTGRALS